MTPSMAPTLETLPLLILERVCEYLDDDSEKRRSLWAFSLTSRYCCAAAAAQRFCQIQLRIPAPDKLESCSRRWNEMLNPDGRHRYVRRLKVMAGEEPRKEGLQRQDEEAEDDEYEDEDRNTRHRFDMHDFCRPSEGFIGWGSMTDNPEDWLPLARFISQLPALKDLVWAYGTCMPRFVLSAIHARGCRLHMHDFRLHSLIQSRNSPQPIDPDEYALATSPSLSSIVVEVFDFESENTVNYTKEALMRMVTGMAPGLAHVWLIQRMENDELWNHPGMPRRSKPAWGGFFPGTASEADQLPMLGSLQSLVFSIRASTEIDKWSRYTDFTKLRRLTMPWRLECGVVFAEMVMRGDFKSLDTLELLDIEDETDQAQEALHRTLKNLNPLQRLSLTGYISNETFHIVLRRHGRSLRNLLVNPCLSPYRDDESRNPLVVFSEEAVLQHLTEQCVNLEEVDLWINRTRGDDRETGIYRALSKLPRLRRAFLRLWYSVGPDEESWDEERDGEYPFSSYISAEEIPFAYLREAFSNSALDATLALSIFNLISSGGSLRYLRLEMSWKTGQLTPGLGSPGFEDILRWFRRPWACKRDARGRVTVRELDKEGTAVAGKEWQYLSNEPLYDGQDIYKKVFKDIWPQRTAEWWKDWKSLPLSDGAA